MLETYVMFAVKCLLLLCGLWLTAGQAQQKEPPKDQESIQGTWQLQSGERNGKALPESVVQGIKLTFAGNKLTTKNKDRSSEAKFTLHAEGSPKKIDLDMDGNVGQGLYELDGDTLKIVHGEVGEPRPTKFDTKGQTGLTLLVLKREKP
jgi:uncharacterized protein (TIGR03067 family)